MRNYGSQRQVSLRRGALDIGWRERGLCSPATAHLFYVERGAGTKPAKRICARCPVREECLEYALTTAEKGGIWGGLSERERRRIRKSRQQEAEREEAA